LQSGESAGQTGEVDVLQEFLRDRLGIDKSGPADEKGKYFGQNLNHVFAPGQAISAGDRFKVLEQADEANFQLTAG
jgi:hypothetical protein